MEKDDNKLASGYLICNSIYTSNRNQKSRFYVDPGKRKCFFVDDYSCYS